MLTLRHARGVSLIELIVGLCITAILFAIALPNFSIWLQGSRIRTAAEAIQNGLQLTRGEAVRRNTYVHFYLVDGLTGSCNVLVSGTSWIVGLDDPTGACNTAPSEVGAVRIFQARSGLEGSLNVLVNADQASITFNGVGRVTPVPGADININITANQGGCIATGGTIRCLRVVVSSGGQIRLCDPARPATDPQGC